MLTVHVDDLFSTGNDNFEKEVHKPLLKRFHFGAVSEAKELKVLSLNIVQKGKDILINQRDYIAKKIEYVDVEKTSKDTLSTQLSGSELQ